MINNKRQSNIELLKIIAMFFICISHVVNPIIYAGEFPAFTIGGELVYTFIKNLGWLGDYIFIAASAYFLVGNKKFNVKKFVLYYLEVLLVFFIYLGVFVLFKIPVSDIPTFEEAKRLTINTLLIYKYWYIVAYLLFLVLLPLVNMLIDVLPRKVHLALCWVSIPFGLGALVLHNTVFDAWWFDVYIFIFMTFIMSYGRRYGWYLCFREDNKKGLVIGLVSVTIFWILKNVIFSILGVYGYAYQPSSFSIAGLNDPLYFIFGITLFLLFKGMNIKNSKVINFTSSLSLLFYVSHHNKYTSLVFEQPMMNLISNNIKWRLMILLAAAVARFVYGLVAASVMYFMVHIPLSLAMNVKIKKGKSNNISA